MKNRYKLLADVVAVLHALLVLGALASIPLLLLISWWKFVVLIVLLITVVTWVIFHNCQLRIWELNLRRRYHPQTAYDSTFIAHYLGEFLRLRVSDKAVRVFVNVLAAGLAIELLVVFLG